MKLDGKSFGCGVGVGLGLSSMLFGMLVLVGVILYQAFSSNTASSADLSVIPADGDPAVTEELKEILRKHNIPALTTALVTSEGIQEIGVAGFRKRGEDVAATLKDDWHLGSNGKAMTATLIARLVERGDLGWETTVAEVFPEQADDFDPDMREVTVEQLLAHQSGLPANLSLRRYRGDDVRELRRRAVREYLAERPSFTPGTRKAYSNLGYIIAGALVEETLDLTWEEAIRNEVFDPLGMTSADFGGMGTRGEIDQPWPHRNNGSAVRHNGPDMDNPPVMGPAGRIHCSMEDWAKFIRDQLRGARGDSETLLQLESYKKLHTPLGDSDYALGWLVLERGWGNGTVFHQSGDNTMNRANVWMAPKKDFAVMACANQGGDDAHAATDAAVSILIGLAENLSAPSHR